MSPVQWNKALVLVDGDMEKKFFQAICNDIVVQKIGLNGDAVQIKAIADRVVSLFRLQNNRCEFLVVVFDRERRKEGPLELVSELRTALVACGVPSDKLYVGCADRCTEGWIMCDLEIVAEYLNCDDPGMIQPGQTKGCLKRACREHGLYYTETIEGVELMRKVRPSQIAEKSESFANFFGSIGDECWWLKH